MKKRVVSFMLLVSFILMSTVSYAGIFSAFKKKDSKPAEKVKISMWLKGSGTDPGLDAVMKKFNESQDRIEASYEAYGDSYTNVVNLALKSGNAPDIFESDRFSVPIFAKSGLLVALDNVISKEIKANFYEGEKEQKSYTYEGHQYSIPTRVTSFRLLYNKDLFIKAGLDPNKPPRTMDEVIAYAKKITEAGNGDFYGFGLYLGSSNIWTRILDPVNAASGINGPMSFDFKNGQFNFNDDMAVFNKYLQLGKDGSLLPGFETLGVDQMRANFAKGTVAMYIDGSWTSGLYAVQMPTEIDWDAAPVPALNTYNKGLATLGVDYAVPATSKHPEEAKEFLKFYIENLDLKQEFNPDPKTYIPANDIAKLPVKSLNLKGYKTNFDLSDLATFPMEPHKLISLKGENRDSTYTRMYLEQLDTNKVNVNEELANLTKVYNTALNESVKNGIMKEEELKISNFAINNR